MVTGFPQPRHFPYHGKEASRKVESVKHFFENKPISPSKRVLGPFLSALVSFLLPGAAQALNGQIVKGGCMMLGWLCMYSLAQANQYVYAVVKILQYILMVAASSDAYFIASRMKLGESVRTWSILFFDIQAPTETGAASRRNAGFATLITNVTVIDGTGAPAFVSDVLLQGDIIGRIQPHIERRGKDYTVVDGSGRVLIPGLLTPDCCCESCVFGGDEHTEAVRQGITTEVLGQNGQSLAPIREASQVSARKFFSAVHGRQVKDTSFSDTGLYLMELDRQPYPVRTESAIGYGTLRGTVLGSLAETPDEQALERLCKRVRSGIESGAKGISFGMAYPPCCFLQENELRAVFQTVAVCGGVIFVQPPLEEGTLLPTIRRMGELACETGASLIITGVHAIGTDCEQADTLCREVSALRRNGLDLTLAVTGLEQASFGLMALVPAQTWQYGGEKIFIYPDGEEGRRELFAQIAKKITAVGGVDAILLEGGQNLRQISEQKGCTPEETVVSLLRKTDGAVEAVLLTEDQAFMSRLMTEPFTCLCTDDRPAGWTDYTLPYYLGHYVQEEKILSMEEAVYKNTMKLAAKLKLWDRGLIREGMSADLVLLRTERLPNELTDDAARGISKVWVRGMLQYDSDPTLDLHGRPKTKILGIQMRN